MSNRKPRSRLSTIGLRASAIDDIFERAYRDMNAIEEKVDALIASTSRSTSQSALTFGSTQVRHGVVVITEGTNVVSFGTQVATTNYRLLVQAFNSAGDELTLGKPTKTRTTFRLSSPDAGLLTYILFALPAKTIGGTVFTR